MFRKLWEKWKAFGRFLGNVVARVVMTIFYFTIFLPFGLATTLFSDRLGIKAVPKRLWQKRNPNRDDLNLAQRQM